MAKTLQFRRGTTSELSTQTGAVGELFVDTTKDTVVVMDGSTTGGFPLQRELLSGTSIKTINGQSVLGNGDITIAGGSGSSYDQDLNTTDDVVFNSALVGDVSIVGNTIGAIDSYGNADTLVVNSNFSIGKDTITNMQYALDATTNSAISARNSGYITIPKNLFYNSQAESIQKLLSLTSGSTITLKNVNISGFGFYGDAVISILGIIETATEINIYDNYFDVNGFGTYHSGYAPSNFGFTAIQFTYNEESISTIFSATETGVAINGAFTVNGQPVATGSSGSSFDQSLNTTDDVVFNSALVGDVSIVGNIIAGVDSYGLPKDLIVDSKIITPALDVRVYTNGSVNYEAVPSYGISPYIQNYPWQSSLSIYNYGGTENSAVINALTALAGSGSRVNFSITTMNGTSVGYFTVNYVSAGGSSYNVYFNQFVVTSGYDLYYTGMSVFGATFTIGEIVESLPLSVTETGIAVTGSLTVNGQEITPSITYDQDLNTIDDVVFNSALIGDVLVVGNTIGATDSYGNPDTIVINSDMQVSFGGETVITGNSTGVDIMLQLYNYDVSFFILNGGYLDESFVRALYNNDPDSTPTVTINFSGQNPIEMTGRLRPANQGYGSGLWGFNNNPAQQNGIYFDTNYLNEITINGNPVTNIGGWNTNFIAGNQVTFTTGTPAITSLSVTESGVAINGDLTLVDNSATPTNTSTVVKWAKIIVGGQVYYTPLYQ